ncbi:glycoside hydrolase family 32 protein [Plantibacter flavus]|uniref:GH32 C-terminal domain-containing protein n=1 Tax=Plantibacter flavus TaxID=150123 RepID=UPI003F15B30F
MTAADTSTVVAAPARPLLHFTPQRNWMNDPNGLLFHEGVYHLFFQYNPNGLDHGDVSWGHATSTDLLRWQELPLAISFDAEEMVFSGSAVVDHENSSGLGDGTTPPMVAIYTSARADGIQAQSLAYSRDGGTVWQKYAGNPVLDRRSAEFRDPKVFRYEGVDESFWVMVAVEATERRVLLHRSDDLVEWTFLSSYGPAGAVGGVWECPDLFPLPVDGDPERVRWVLLISLNPGGVAGGSGTQYVVGDFDGHTFTADRAWPAAEDEEALRELDWLDWGRDCYAGVTFSGLPGDQRTLIAWMSNWDYAKHLPTEPWRGSMTTARRLSLVSEGGRQNLRSSPVLPAGEAVVRLEDVAVEGRVEVGDLPAVARIEVDAVGAEGVFALELRGVDGLALVRVDLDGGRLQLDRTAATGGGDIEHFASVETMPLPAGERTSLVIVHDHGSLEVFTADGRASITDLVFLGGGVRLAVVSETGVRLTALAVDDLSAGLR